MPNCVPWELHCFTFLSAMYEDCSLFVLFLFLPMFVVVSVFNYSHPSGCEVISHCSFDLHFPNSGVEHLFMSNLCMLFGEMSIQILCQFLHCIVFLIVEFKSSIYGLVTGSLSDV